MSVMDSRSQSCRHNHVYLIEAGQPRYQARKSSLCQHAIDVDERHGGACRRIRRRACSRRYVRRSGSQSEPLGFQNFAPCCRMARVREGRGSGVKGRRLQKGVAGYPNQIDGRCGTCDGCSLAQ